MVEVGPRQHHRPGPHQRPHRSRQSSGTGLQCPMCLPATSATPEAAAVHPSPSPRRAALCKNNLSGRPNKTRKKHQPWRDRAPAGHQCTEGHGQPLEATKQNTIGNTWSRAVLCPFCLRRGRAPGNTWSRAVLCPFCLRRGRAPSPLMGRTQVLGVSLPFYFSLLPTRPGAPRKTLNQKTLRLRKR
jgi:hypothetical protein